LFIEKKNRDMILILVRNKVGLLKRIMK